MRVGSVLDHFRGFDAGSVRYLVNLPRIIRIVVTVFRSAAQVSMSGRLKLPHRINVAVTNHNNPYQAAWADDVGLRRSRIEPHSSQRPDRFLEERSITTEGSIDQGEVSPTRNDCIAVTQDIAGESALHQHGEALLEYGRGLAPCHSLIPD